MTIEIVNTALDLLGVPTLSNLSGDSDVSNAVTRNLPKSIAYTMRMSDWTEATLTVCPSEIEVDPLKLPDGFCYAFALPGDFSHGYDVFAPPNDDDGFFKNIFSLSGAFSGRKGQFYNTYGSCQRIPWTIRPIKPVGQSEKPVLALLTNYQCVSMEYVSKDCLVSLPQDLQDLIGIDLAKRLVVPLKANESKLESLDIMFRRQLMEAASMSGGQDNEFLEIPNGPISDARDYLLGGYYYDRPFFGRRGW